jgi:hypothetical protein
MKPEKNVEDTILGICACFARMSLGSIFLSPLEKTRIIDDKQLFGHSGIWDQNQPRRSDPNLQSKMNT